MHNKPIINIAILAHVDAGKTTITERILYEAGVLRNIGDVNKGTSTSDFLEVEKQRGISVTASLISFDYDNVSFNIIDTPGHADFIAEVERSLLAVDAVVMVISAADGVQAQTKILWTLLNKLNIPRIVVVNKIDRLGVNTADVIDEIRNKLSKNLLLTQSVQGEGSEDVNVTSFVNVLSNNAIDSNNSIVETLAEYDDDLLEKYLQGEDVNSSYLYSIYRDAVSSAKVFPVLFAVAKSGLGINCILKELISNFSIEEEISNVFSGIIYKVEHRGEYGKLCYVRMFSGEMLKKQNVYNKTQDVYEKINLIKKVFSSKLIDADSCSTGEIVAVTGLLSAAVGDVLGDIEITRVHKIDTQALLTVQVKALDSNDYFKLSEALSVLNIEDPQLRFKWYKDEQEYHLMINGWIQIQILEQILKDRFGIETKFETPQIIYKETPSAIGFGKGVYTMPKPCWAVIKLKIEPGERGSGVVYSSSVGVNNAQLKYQKEVERTISYALEQGIKGWEVTDVIISLIEAEDHVMHSRAGDFAIVTPMAVMNGLKEIGTELLEPILNFEINATDNLLGQISGDLHKMRAVFNQPIFNGSNVVLRGKIPAATSLEYPVQLASRSGGEANIQMSFCCYQKVNSELGVIRDYKGISPLDRSKYILKARNAIR